MDAGPGCGWVLMLLAAFWAGVVFLVYHPPGDEDIPYFVAGFVIALIFSYYTYRNRE